MTYTTHGYHISGTVLNTNEEAPYKARCGGPGLCPLCSREAAASQEQVRAEGIPTDEPSPELKVVEPPTEPGFYRYDGGNQNMVFLLNGERWYTLFDNTTFSECAWGFIEQALGVYNLVKIVSDAPDKDSVEESDISGVPEPQVVMELPIFMPGNNRNWEKVDGKARIEADGTINVTLTKPEMSEELVEMCKRNTLFQLSLDYRMGLDEMEKVNNQFQMEYADDDTLFKAYEAIRTSLFPPMEPDEAADVLWSLQQAGVVIKEVK